MKLITDAAIYEAATKHPEPDFCTLLSKLLTTISCDGEFDPAELVRLVIIEPGDTLETANTELGYTLTPDWEACDKEGTWTALTYVTSDWGDGLLVFMEALETIDPAFLRLCSETPESR